MRREMTSLTFRHSCARSSGSFSTMSRLKVLSMEPNVVSDFYRSLNNSCLSWKTLRRLSLSILVKLAYVDASALAMQR